MPPAAFLPSSSPLELVQARAPLRVLGVELDAALDLDERFLALADREEAAGERVDDRGDLRGGVRRLHGHAERELQVRARGPGAVLVEAPGDVVAQEAVL